MEGTKKKVVVAYSGGLDTSYTVMYLAKELGYEVYAACADTGGFSPAQLKANEENAYKLGAKHYVTLDVTQEYYAKSLKYMIYGNVLRNGTYPISVSSERIFQAIAIARYANEVGADAIAHGSTGAGNDQVRFDMTFLVMAPGVEILTLTRDNALSRDEEIEYLRSNGFVADFTKMKYSYNVGIWGTSICGGEILDSKQGLPDSAYLKQVEKDGKEEMRIEFKHGEIVAVNGKAFDNKIEAIRYIESIAAPYGIGRDMHVGDTIIGIKGRVGFEAAAPMVIINAQMAAILERPGGKLVWNVPAREPVSRACDARHRGYARIIAAQRQRHSDCRVAPAVDVHGGCRLSRRLGEDEIRRIRRNAERLDCRRRKRLHKGAVHSAACLLCQP